MTIEISPKISRFGHERDALEACGEPEEGLEEVVSAIPV